MHWRYPASFNAFKTDGANPHTDEARRSRAESLPVGALPLRNMETTLLLLATSLIANDRSRSYLLRVAGKAATASAALLARLWTAAFAYVLSLVFGEDELLTLGNITPLDCTTSYSDGVYEVRHDGFRVIQWLTSTQVRNHLAFGRSVAYTVAL